jgi:transcriptional regulator GlxA family with amidase domain
VAPLNARRYAMQIEIVVFDGFDEMDAVAPFEVFRTAAELGAPIDAELVGAHGAGTITASDGLRLVVDRGPSEAPDLMLVPGGGWFHGAGVRAEIERGVSSGRRGGAVRRRRRHRDRRRRDFGP